MNAAIMSQLVAIIVPIGVCVVLPVMCVWLTLRAKINKDNANKEILVAALNQNSELDLEQILEKLSPKKKLLKEKLLTKLIWSIICLITGLGLTIPGICIYAGGANTDSSIPLFIFGIPTLAVGIAFLVNFILGKKMLAKEIEAEEKQKIQQ